MAATADLARKEFVRLDPRDNVIIATKALAAGSRPTGNGIALAKMVPPGHKIATVPIAKGEPVLKFGQIIGYTMADIAPGEHIHTHNLLFGAHVQDYHIGEDFRPVAPVVLEERAHEWFRPRVAGELRAAVNAGPLDSSVTRSAFPAPFMLFVFDVEPAQAERIPAVRHVDGTARVQTVRHDQNRPYYELLRAFERHTGVPVLVNTSFNTRGEPMICSPRDALETFWTSPLDALVIGPFLVEKPSCATA